MLSSQVVSILNIRNDNEERCRFDYVIPVTTLKIHHHSHFY